MPGRHVSQVWTYHPTLDAPAKYRRACKYDAFIPVKLAELSFSLEATVAGVVSEAEGAIRQLNESARPALAPLARLLLRTESMASSKIEGVQTGVRELARAEAKVEAGGKASVTALEVLANIDAMQLAMDEASAVKRFGVREIVAIHRRLMQRDFNAKRIAGQIRTTQNWIGGNDYNPCGADYVPPPPDEVPGLLDDLCDAINDDRLPPIVQAALVHAQFETIHPFADGNGRSGRALVHVILKRRRVAPAYVPPISVVLAAGRDRYIAGLARFRGERVSDWIEQFAAAARGAARLAEAYLGEVQQLGAAWRAKLSARRAPPRADAGAWAVIDVLPGYPVISAPVAAAVTGRSKPQIYEALEQLEEAGVLKPLSASRRNRAWEAVGLLVLLERLEAGQLPH
ncbi:MAG TPA: Fic family protein [Gemmatimonadales bacterium]|nr:Fic family protein [Gemmatimonadales bacterium]